MNVSLGIMFFSDVIAEFDNFTFNHTYNYKYDGVFSFIFFRNTHKFSS